MQRHPVLLTLVLLWASACSPQAPGAPESFDTFYKRFRTDVEFQQRRTIFPLKRIIFTSQRDPAVPEKDEKSYAHRGADGSVVHPSITVVQKDDRWDVFPVDDVMRGDEKEGFAQTSPDSYESHIDLRDGTRALTYRFSNKDGRWFLSEYVDAW